MSVYNHDTLDAIQLYRTKLTPIKDPNLKLAYKNIEKAVQSQNKGPPPSNRPDRSHFTTLSKLHKALLYARRITPTSQTDILIKHLDADLHLELKEHDIAYQLYVEVSQYYTAHNLVPLNDVESKMALCMFYMNGELTESIENTTITKLYSILDPSNFADPTATFDIYDKLITLHNTPSTQSKLSQLTTERLVYQLEVNRNALKVKENTKMRIENIKLAQRIKSLDPIVDLVERSFVEYYRGAGRYNDALLLIQASNERDRLRDEEILCLAMLQPTQKQEKNVKFVKMMAKPIFYDLAYDEIENLPTEGKEEGFFKGLTGLFK